MKGFLWRIIDTAILCGESDAWKFIKSGIFRVAKQNHEACVIVTRHFNP